MSGAPDEFEKEQPEAFGTAGKDPQRADNRNRDNKPGR
jgi:hypothetical protein